MKDDPENSQRNLGPSMNEVLEKRALRTAELKEDLTDDEYQRLLAGAKLLGGLSHLQNASVGIEKGSLYGAVLLVPQVARTLGWPRLLTATTVKVYGFLVFCYCCHGGLLTLLAKEESFYDQYAGQPYLCDGYTRGGKGPGGTHITDFRLYSYADWVTRCFFRDSLKALFPERSEWIDQHVDAGEYGSETYFGRLICCFLYIGVLNSDLLCVMQMGRLIWFAPDERVRWIEANDNLDGSFAKHSIDWYLDHVTVKVGGLSRKWKIINFIVLLIPKLVLWVLTALTGVTFLMETSSIDDVIVNSCGLAFLLSLDNIILDNFSDAEVRCLMDRCEDMIVYNQVLEDNLRRDEELQEDDIMHSFHFEQRLGEFWLRFLWASLPLRWVSLCIMTWLLVQNYYWRHCKREENGRWVSQDMYTPPGNQFTFADLVYQYIVGMPEVGEPFWTMPS